MRLRGTPECETTDDKKKRQNSNAVAKCKKRKLFELHLEGLPENDPSSSAECQTHDLEGLPENDPRAECQTHAAKKKIGDNI